MRGPQLSLLSKRIFYETEIRKHPLRTLSHSPWFGLRLIDAQCGNAIARQAHGKSEHTWLVLSKTITHTSLVSPRPTTFAIWDTPSPQELSRPSFRGCTDTIRVSSSLPPVHTYSPSSWVSDLVIRAVVDLRAFDPHFKVLAVAFACSTAHVCLCVAIKAGKNLADNRNILLQSIDDNMPSMSWYKYADVLVRADSHLATKITAAHLTECRSLTEWVLRLSAFLRLLVL